MGELREKITNLYKRIQKIPYYCLKERDPNKLLKINKGSCLEKHVFLGKEYEKLGIPVKYLSIKFDWRESPIPKEIIEKKDNPLGGHLALKIKTNEKWIIVDSTWDLELEKAGFPVTRDWGGKTDTKLAVKPIEITELKKRPGKTTVETNPEFFDSLNKHLEMIR